MLLCWAMHNVWLATALTAVAWGHRVPVSVAEGGYDSVLQDLSRLQAAGDPPDVIVLLPWHQRLLRSGATPSPQHLEEELAFWRQAWGCTAAWPGTHLLQVGYDWMTPGVRGMHLGGRPIGVVARVRELNARLRDQLSRGATSSTWSRFRVGSAVPRFTTRGDISRPNSLSASRGFANSPNTCGRGFALTTGPRKVLAVDLDNTLWGGVVAETGPLGIALGEGPEGEAYGAFQSHLKELKRRGILLVAASKNNPEDAREPSVRNPNMVLGLDNFAALEVSWEPKSIMLQRLADTLNLGLDSFVFFDDNPAEREQMPARPCPRWPWSRSPKSRPRYVRVLQAGHWFEAMDLTEEDRQRAEQYRLGRATRTPRRLSFAGRLPHLPRNGGGGTGNRRGGTAARWRSSWPRPTNSTMTRSNGPKRTSPPGRAAGTAAHTAGPGSLRRPRVGTTLLGVPLAGEHPETVQIDTWLMSCRVIGRTVEHFFFGAFLARGRELGYRRAIGEYVPTKKNVLSKRLI